MGATDQPRYTDFRGKAVRVISALQCILFTKSTFSSPKTCLALVMLGLPKYTFHLSILGEIISN